MSKEYITLKEAANISGYSSDYVGQLIREGKIPGRQIYANIAWITTKDAVLKYKNKQRGGGGRSTGLVSRLGEKVYELKNRLVLELRFAFVLQWFFYVAIGISIILMLGIFYTLSISVDRKLEKDALNKSDLAPIKQIERGDVIEGVPAL